MNCLVKWEENHLPAFNCLYSGIRLMANGIYIWRCIVSYHVSNLLYRLLLTDTHLYLKLNEVIETIINIILIITITNMEFLSLSHRERLNKQNFLTIIRINL